LVLAGTLLVVVVAAAAAYLYHQRIAAARPIIASNWLIDQSDHITIGFAVLAFALVVSIGIAACSTARHVTIGKPPTGRITVNPVRGWTVFWAGSAFAVALAYSMGNLDRLWPSNVTKALFEFSTLRYALAPFAVALIAVALVIPLVFHEPSNDDADANPGHGSQPSSWWRRQPGRFIAPAAFGWAVVTQLPPLVVADVEFPAAQFLLAVIVCVIVKRHPRVPAPVVDCTHLPLPTQLAACQPRPDRKANAILAAKIAAILAIIPVGYFIYTTATQNLALLQQSGPGTIFIVAGAVSQVTGWILTGIIFAMLSPRLPGRVGPVRAFVLTGAWFAAALTIQLINYWTYHSIGWAWSFPGLLLLLFLVTFSVVWDAFILNPTLSWGTWMATLSKVAETYKIERTRAIILYAVPVLAALIAVGEQLANGHAAEFIKGLLSLASAAAGG
jgi:hypothetical protein